MIPVRSRLIHSELVCKRFTGGDAVETDARNSVHIRRNDDSVPMDRSRRGQTVRDAHGHEVPFAPVQQRTRHEAIDGRGDTTSACQVDGQLIDSEVEIRAPQDGTVGSNVGVSVSALGPTGALGPAGASGTDRSVPNDPTRGEHTACGHTLHEPAS